MKTSLEVQQFCTLITPTVVQIQSQVTSFVGDLELKSFEKLCTLPEEKRLAIESELAKVTELGSELWLTLDSARRAFAQANSYMQFLKDTGKSASWYPEKEVKTAEDMILKDEAKTFGEIEEQLNPLQIAMMIKLLKARATK